MPVAGTTPLANEFLTSLAASDDPDAAEAALAALPAQQREALMRSTVSSGARR
jgi:DNA-directed RNA polymerase specialized sigma24 family protein